MRRTQSFVSSLETLYLLLILHPTQILAYHASENLLHLILPQVSSEREKAVNALLHRRSSILSLEV